MKRVRSLAIIFALAISAGCRQQESAAPTPAARVSSNTVRIASISPSTDTPLGVGEKVTFKVEVEYTLASAASASITLVIQQGESGRMPLANETQVIQKGSAKVALSKDVEIPETNALQVFTPLTVQGGTATSIVDTRVYKVVKK